VNLTNIPSDLQAKVAGSSFYSGMRVLPRAEREAMYAIYAFCRIVDDIADDQSGDRAARKTELGAWREDIDALYAGGDPGRTAFLSDAVRRFGLDQQDLLAVIDGMQMDVDADIRWPSRSELDVYCEKVASAVGRLSVRVFGMDPEPGRALAYHLGRALQLTNILRDIDEDALIGRVYLPREGLEAAGIALTTPAAVVADQRVDQAARGLADDALRHFAEAHAILAARPRGRLVAPRLMQAAYSRLLNRMVELGWRPPRRRVRVSKPALLWSAVRFSVLP
jgi:squalene synthase HpnD